jgi:hypothetical protein
MCIFAKMLVTAMATCLVIAMPIGAAAQTDLPVLGTIGIDPSGNLTAIQKAFHDQPLGPSLSWHLSVHDTVVPRMISDFDGDKLDDFIIRSDQRMGIVGNDAADNLVLKAAAPYGPIDGGWILSPEDEVVAVGRFAGSDRPAQMVLKRNPTGSLPNTPLFAFVAAERGRLRAKTVVYHGDWIMDPTNAVGWLVSPGDKVIGVGQLDRKTDGLVVTSGWGMGIWVPKWSGEPDLLFIAPNGEEFRDPDGLHSRTWKLDTTDPSFRLLGISDIDEDQQAEMILASSSGFAVLNKHGPDVWGSTALALRFHLDQGEAFSGTTIVGSDVVAPPFRLDDTKDRLVSMMDFNKNGGADLLFQRLRPADGGITVLGKRSDWSFEVIASRNYGSYIGGWAFGSDDRLSPLAGDFDGDAQDDFPITSGWGLGVLTTSGVDFGAIGVAAYDWLSLTSSVQLVGAGKFDRTGRQRLLFKMPPPTASLFAVPNPVPAPGDPSDLFWNSENTSSCTGTPFDYARGRSKGGPESTGPVYGPLSFSITCTGEAGGTDTKEVTVDFTHICDPSVEAEQDNCRGDVNGDLRKALDQCDTDRDWCVYWGGSNCEAERDRCRSTAEWEHTKRCDAICLGR